MSFKIGDLVTRNSYNNDVVFKIKDIKDNKIILMGIDVRLYADALDSDLSIYNNQLEEDDESLSDRLSNYLNLNRDEYFYLPGRILHIDGDEEYLNRCLKFYNKANINAYGLHVDEIDMPNKIERLLDEIRPDILIITGHDAYYAKRGNKEDIESYKNTFNFIKTVQQARHYEKSHDKLIIIAGACQSNYEALIRAGATFASSPKRVNIHALDPAIIAVSISLSDKAKDINLLEILDKTKYGSSGIGGVITKGTMYTGYPR